MHFAESEADAESGHPIHILPMYSLNHSPLVKDLVSVSSSLNRDLFKSFTISLLKALHPLSSALLSLSLYRETSYRTTSASSSNFWAWQIQLCHKPAHFRDGLSG